ncbi:MAG: ABC transporter permease, partial [Ewingella sp.]|nr:ABC transporter permease [Ewingella sp.]
MKAYLAKKLIAFPVILIGVSMLIFGSIRALPGDPARLMAGPEATQEAVDNMRVRLGLDQPIVTQDVHFATDVLHGNLGLSLQSQQPVTQEIGERLPYTLALAVLAYFLAVVIGVPAGMIG